MTKIGVLLISLNLFCCFTMHSQENVDSVILKIREEYNQIQAQLKNYPKKYYIYKDSTSNPSTIKFEAHYLPHGRLVKLNAIYTLDNDFYNSEYYFQDNRVFFCFDQIKRPDGTQIQERIYYNSYEYAPIRKLIKEKKVNDLRNFSKIENVIINCKYSDELHFMENHVFYGDRIIEKYLNYPIFNKCDDINQKILRIKAEYDMIETHRVEGTLNEKNVNYHDNQAYWYNTSYRAYFNDKSEMVLLTYAFSDEGYYTCDSVYFKDRKPFFILSTQSEPGDKDYTPELYTEWQSRFYIYNDLIIRHLYKEKKASNNIVFSEIPNIDETNADEQENSKSVLNSIYGEIYRLNMGFAQKVDNAKK